VGEFAVTNEASVFALNALSAGLNKASDGAEKAKPSIAGVWVAMGQSQVGAAGIALLENYIGLVNEASRGTAVWAEAVRKAQVGAPSALPQNPGLPNISGGGFVEWERQNEVIDAAAKAAESAAKAFRALKDEISGEKMRQDVSKLADAWGALTDEQRRSTGAIATTASKYMALIPALEKVPPALRESVAEMNRIAIAAGQMDEAVTSGLRSLDGIGTPVKQALEETLLAFMAFESKLRKGAKKPIEFGIKLDERAEKNFIDTVLEIDDRLSVINKRGLARRLEELRIAKRRELEALRANNSLTVQQYEQLRAKIDAIYTEMEQDAKDASTSIGEALSGAMVQIGTELPGILLDTFTGNLKGEELGKAIGAAVGGAIGYAFGGPVGGAAGAAIGQGIAEMFSTKAEQTVKKVARDFGVRITEEMGQAIVDTAGDLFDGNQVAAQIFHLDDIIEAAGGLNMDNILPMFERLRDVFVQVETGAFSAAQGMEVLDKSFQKYADFVTKGGSLASKQLLEIIDLNERAGTHSSAVMEYVNAQASSALKGVGAFITTRGDILQKIADAQAKIQALTAKGGKGDEIKQAREELAKFQAQLDAIPLTAGGADAFGASLFAIFEQLTREGTPALDVIRQIDPLIQSLDRQLQAAGLSGGAAFGMLRDLAGLATDEIAGPAFTAVSGLGSALEGLHNSGLLNQEMFAGLAEQITATYGALEAQGKGGENALRLMAGPLQDLWELQKDFGYEVDAATQKLLDQADEAGVVGEEHRSVQEKMLAAMEKTAEAVQLIANLFGEHLPTQIGRTTDAINRIPRDVRVRVNYDEEGMPDGPGGGGSSDLPGHAAGGVFSTAHTARIAEGGQPEIVGSVGFMTRALEGALATLGTPASAPADSGEQTIQIVLDGDVLTSVVLKRAPRLMRAYGV
jgi:hypothetical protein